MPEHGLTALWEAHCRYGFETRVDATMATMVAATYVDSRTIGTDRIVDEVVFRYTHTATIDWMLPGIARTGRTVEVPLLAIAQLRGKVAHATARKVLDPNRPSNTLLGDARRGGEGKPV